MAVIQFEGAVNDDGVLELRVPIGLTAANMRVMVTIAPSTWPTRADDGQPSDWHDFVRQTYGSCADLGLEEQEYLLLQPRDSACNVPAQTI